jgi:dTDP-4-amino-4,6-dideoxygalactose transaminase
MAALAIVGLRYLDQDNAQRREIARWYDEELTGQKVTLVAQPEAFLSSRHLYQILVENRDEVMVHMMPVPREELRLHRRERTNDFLVYEINAHRPPKSFSRR